MLEFPQDIQEADILCIAANHLKQEQNPCYPIWKWINTQLSTLDMENRFEIDDTVFKQRQGAAQAISQIIDYINNNRELRERLESLRLSQEGGTKNV